jgi:hypothetical protein
MAVWALSICSVSLCFAQIQPVVTGDQGSGNVDWSARFITATGIGAPNPDMPEAAARPAAIRAAQQLALRNALETIKGVNLNSTTTVSNFMVQNDVVTTNVSGFLKGFEQQGQPKYMSDGSVEVTMKIPLDGIGGLGEMLIGNSLTEQPAISKFEGTKAPKEIIFTGLIIDCKGLSIKPALSPRVLDESGREVYGSAYVSREWAIKYGIVGYAKEETMAVKLVDRIGKNPGKIKAQKAHGENSTDIVISAADAADVRSASANLKFLSECRVILIID